MSGVGAEPLQAHVLHVLQTQTPRESRRGAAGPWSWGFRGDPALSHTPLQDAGWGGSGSTGLSYSVMSVCPPALRAWGQSVRKQGAA